MNNYFLIKATYLMIVKTNMNCWFRTMVRVTAVREFRNNKPLLNNRHEFL